MTPEQGITRLKALKSKTDNWQAYWQDLASFCLPAKAYITSKYTSGSHLDFLRIFDNTAITSLKTMASGFHSHLTNPSSKWFSIELANKKLMESKDVKIWLKEVEEKIFLTLNNSNFDSTMQEFYKEAGCFGTSAIFIEEDFKDGVRFTGIPIGEMFIEEDASGRVNRFYRNFTYTAQQAWDRWGKDAGIIVQEAIMKDQKPDKEIDILHWIIPREKRQAGKEDNLNMEFESVWIEVSKKHLIHEGGYTEFPVAVGRQFKKSGEAWGFSTTMDILADIKMINKEKQTLIRAAMKVVDPPMIVPNKGVVLPLNMNPRAVNYRSRQLTNDDIGVIKTEARIDIGIEMIKDVRASIEEGYFVPLFKAFSQITKQMTIPEVQRRISENMVLLGPVVGRYTKEVLDPLIFRTFNIQYRNGEFPDPPQEIEGQELDIVYISQLAKSQRQAEILSLERSLGTVGEMSKFIPSVLQKINGDKAVDLIFEINGTDPEVLFDDDEVAEIRAAELEAAQRQQQAAEMEQAAGVAETVSKTEKNMQGA